MDPEDDESSIDELEVVPELPQEATAVIEQAANDQNVPKERVTIAGIEVDQAGSIDPDRIAKVTSGRRQIPLSMIFRHGGLDSAQSAGIDHYIAVVCYDIVNDNSIKVSNLNFTGTTEAILNIGDMAEISIELFRNSGLLILNPCPTGPTSLRIPSARACLRSHVCDWVR